MKIKILSITKNGKNLAALVRPGFEPLFEFDRITDAGWIQIEECGQENLYFTFTCDAGLKHHGYCKCL